MGHRSVRTYLLLAAPLLVGVALLPACWNSDSLGGLFGAPSDGGSGNGGFDPGTGGGLVLRDLFLDARLLRDAPTIVTVAPADGTKNVSIKSPIVVQFSESMVATGVRSGLSLFAKGSTQSTATTVTMLLGDTLALVFPQTDLLPNQDYEISVPGNVTDLQGNAITIPNNQTDVRFAFTTAAQGVFTDLEVIFSAPAQQEGNVPRGNGVAIVFSEPINTSIGSGGINGPGNFVTSRNGTTLVLGTDYLLSTFPTAGPRALLVGYFQRADASAQIDAEVSKAVESADGQKTIKGNNGFKLSFECQEAAIPDDISFPASVPVIGADGAISSSTLHAFPADVALTADGQLPDTTTIIYFDASNQNSLLFEKSASDPTQFVTDLEPQTTPALDDGDIVVGSFVENRGFRSEVSVIKSLVKDTVGPRLLAMGPPSLGGSIFFTQVNDPVMHGSMTEPCAGVQIDFDGAGNPDFNSIQFIAGLSTGTGDFFVTGASEDHQLPVQLEATKSFSFICSDRFGNIAVNKDSVTQVTVGCVGATVSVPDGTTGLYVVAYAEDDYQLFVTGGDVLLDAWPAEADGAHQIVKSLTASSGVVRFTDAELASIPTAQITVTVLAERAGLFGQPPVLYGPNSYCGLDKPSAASPRAVLALLSPDTSVDLRSDVRCDILNESANPQKDEIGSGFALDIDPTTNDLDKTLLLQPAPSATQNLVSLPKNHLQSFAVAEKIKVGTGLFRFSSSQPFTSEPDAAGGGGTTGGTKTRSVDFFGQAATYSDSTNPTLVHSVDFDDAAVSSGGSVGLLGTELNFEQFRDLRLLCRLPGFVDNTAVGSNNVFTTNGALRSASVLLPLPFLSNDSTATTGFEDSPLEMILQPSLIDPAVAVDPAILRRNLRVELIVQDRLAANTTTPTDAWTRARFLFDPTTNSADVASPQAIPIVSIVNATHPPLLSWPEVTQGEGMHVLEFVSIVSFSSWRFYMPAQAGGGTFTFQLPKMPISLPDGIGQLVFATPGSYQAFVKSYDFDPAHQFDATSTDQFNFDYQKFFQSDAEREFLMASRSDTNFRVDTQ